MSVSDVAPPQVFTASFTLLTGGYAPGTAFVTGVSGAFVPAPLANFGGSSKLLSIVRTAAGGTPGTPSVQFLAPSAAGSITTPWNSQWRMGVISSSNLDTSTYLVTWCNLYAPSQSYTQGSTVLPAVTVTPAALQQFAA